MRPVLVAGCGYVGTALVEQLVAAGREVWGLRRSAADPSRLPAATRWIVADVAEADLGSEPLDVCFLLSPDGHDERAYRRAYLEGLSALASRATIARLVLASSTAVYGDAEGWVDEATPCRPTAFSGRILLEAEALARTLADAVVVRLGGIYGPGRDLTIRRIREGIAIAPATPRYAARIHRDDAAAVFAHLLAVGEGTYAAVDDDPAALADVQAWLCERLGVDPASLAPAPPPRRGGNRRVRNARLRASGFHFRYPSFREGYASLLVGLR